MESSLIAKESFKNSLTKGKDYRVVLQGSDNVTVLDDEGFEIGFSIDKFQQEVINPFKLVSADYVKKEGEYYPWEYYQPLFDYLCEEHNLTLLQGELEELIDVVNNLKQK